jgi:hypothetical protein
MLLGNVFMFVMFIFIAFTLQIKSWTVYKVGSRSSRNRSRIEIRFRLPHKKCDSCSMKIQQFWPCGLQRYSADNLTLIRWIILGKGRQIV